MNHKISFFAALAVAAGMLVASAAGCELIATVDRSKIGGAGGTGTGTGTGGTTTTGTGGTCTDPTTDCPATGTVCITVSCGTDMTCTNTNASAGTACTDNSGTVCDGNGKCVACVMGSDCPPQATKCVTNTCTTNVCGTADATLGTTCTDNNGSVCTATGTCV